MTDEEAIQQLAPIITKKAAKYAAIAKSKGFICDFDDFRSVGMMAVLEACHNLDTEKASLVTRAFSLIDFRMKIELNKGHQHSLGHHNFILRFNKALRELGEDATDTQIIEWSKKIHKHASTRLTEVNIPFLRNLVIYRQLSIDKPRRDMDNNETLPSLELPDEGTSLIDLIIENERKQALYAEIDKLPEKPRDIIKRRLAEQTLEEIGQVYGVTRERIRQIEAKYLPLVCERLKRRLIL